MNDAPPQDDGDRQSGITLRELEVVQALVGAGTAMNAARALGISQSAVSRRLARLEERLGFALFTRSGGRLGATVEALSINEQLGPVFDTLRRIQDGARSLPPTHAGTLSIVAPPTIAHRFLPRLVAAFGKKNPELRIVFEVIASDALVTGVAESRFDVGLTDTVPLHDGIQKLPLFSTAAICMIPDRHRLVDRVVIRPEDLQGETFIALSRRHSSRAVVDRAFERSGVTRRMVIEVSTNVAAMEFVREGIGVALVNPFPIIHQIGEGISIRPFLPEISYTANFLLPSSHAPSVAALAFIETVKTALDRSAYAPILDIDGG